MAGEIGNYLPTAPWLEKLWEIFGLEFWEKQVQIVKVIRELYGLEKYLRRFHKFLGDLLKRIGFLPYIADQDIWWRKSNEYNGYYYIATHVDDLVIVEKNHKNTCRKLINNY